VVVVYALTSLLAGLATLLLLWPISVVAALVAAPFVGSFVVAAVALGVYATETLRKDTGLRSDARVEADTA
jgi:hypothetical protein